MKKSKFDSWLKNRSLTINEFVELIECDRSTLWYWRKGIKAPSAKMMRKVRSVTKNAVFCAEDFLEKQKRPKDL